jgi:CIC family chloride channel protein
MRQPTPNPTRRFLHWVPEVLQLRPNRVRGQVRLLGPAMLVGLVAGFGAVAFYVATQAVLGFALSRIAGYAPEPHPAGEAHLAWIASVSPSFVPWLLLVVPTIGGLLSGFLVFTLAPEAEGHGTDAVIAAYHSGAGYIRPRVPLVKIVSSAITIGTGGSGGREGPIAQIGAGFGSLLAGALRLGAADRRVLLASGMGAGVAAIFRAPLAGALFAAEVLYWSPEFEPEVILPAGVASVVAYCTFGAFFGWTPLFAIPTLEFRHSLQLVPYTLLALFMALLAMLYTRTFYAVTRAFHRLRIPRHVKPAIGAGLTGLVGLSLYFAFGREKSVLAVLAFGYNALQDGMDPSSTTLAAVFLAIALGKILTTSLTIGSGGSGGVFGPSMVIGGCGGAFLCLVLRSVFPQWMPELPSFVIVGMAGFFAAAAKTPVSTLIIVSEMTGGYGLLLPSLWVCVIAFVLSDRQSIYSSQVEGRAFSNAHRGTYVRQVLAGLTVGQFLRDGPPPPAVAPDDSLDGIVALLGRGALSVVPVVDADRRLLGIVVGDEVKSEAAKRGSGAMRRARELMRGDVAPLTPEQTLDQAMEAFVDNDLLALPVVDDLEGLHLIGVVRRFEVANAYLERLHGRPRPEASGDRAAGSA